MLRVEYAAFAYDKKSQLLFKDLSFDINEGEALAILGPNGIGKTTLLRCIMHFLKLREGEVWIKGQPVSQMDNREFWKNISYVPQAKKLVFGYSALNMVVMGLSQNIRFGQTPKKEDYEKGMALLARFGIEDLAEQSCNTLSGGQLQMVLIARALIKDPGILIMDEPESNLDMKNQLIVLNAIEELTKEKNLCVIINTHYPDHALRCTQKTLLLGPKSYLFGETKEVVTAEHIREYFEIDSRILQYERNGRAYEGIIPIDLVG